MDAFDDLSLAIDTLETQLVESRVADAKKRWLSRRKLGIGCSDLPAVWLALGVATAAERASAKAHLVENAAFVFAEKAGVRLTVGPEKPGPSAGTAHSREPALFLRWLEQLRSGTRTHAIEAEINIDSVIHVEAHPALMRILPIVDREEPRLVDSTDGLALTRNAQLAVLQGKCTTSIVAECPWYWSLQVQGQIAVSDAAFGLVICGEGWARRDPPPKWPLRVWVVERDDEKIAQIRQVIRQSWAEIEHLRNSAAARIGGA